MMMKVIRHDGPLASEDGQRFTCVWVGANTRQGKFFPTTYYPYQQGYMLPDCKGLVCEFSKLLDLSLQDIRMANPAMANPKWYLGRSFPLTNNIFR